MKNSYHFTGPEITMKKVLTISIALLLSMIFGYISPIENFAWINKIVFWLVLLHSLYLAAWIIYCLIFSIAHKKIVEVAKIKPHTEPPLHATHVTIEDERDIEIIPAGTFVWRVEKSSEDISKCRGVLNGIERPLMIFTKNLKRFTPSLVVPSD